MNKTHVLAAGFLLVTTMLRPAAAQIPSTSSPLADAARAAVVANAADALRTRYLSPEAGEAAASKIEAQLAGGAYRGLDAVTFAAKMTADLQRVTRDKHMRVSAPADAGPPPVATAPPQLPPPANEGGFVRADRLPGNIGYVEVSGFPQLSAFQPAADKVMAALQDTKGLIIDDRRNGGGTPEAVAYLLSFFIDPSKPPLLLNEFSSRVPGKNEFTTNQEYSVKTPVSYRGKPVYVLTSAQTFSGGEGFAYAMQAFGFGTVVGEVTGGGGHLTAAAPIGSGFVLSVPYARPINPVTSKDWEGVGVIPQVRTTKEEALQAAMRKLGQKVSARDVDVLSTVRLFTPRSAPLPETEPMLRRFLAQLISGAPDYEMLSPGFGDLTRQQLPIIQQRLVAMGAIQSVKFVEVGMQGWDNFDVAFEKGALRWALLLSTDGTRIEGARFGPTPQQ